MRINTEQKLAQLLIRAWPFPYGRGRLIDTFFSRGQFTSGPKSVKTTEGVDLTVDPNDLIGRHIYLSGEFDRSIVDVLSNFSEPGDTLWDVGANIGYVSTCFLSKVPHSKVICVEPQPRILKLLQDNLSKFPGDRYTILPYALSDEDGSAVFETSPTNSGAGRIATAESHSTITVQIRNAEAVFRSNGAGACNIVKIDVEGHEEQVFRSCIRSFEILRPRAIVFEEHNRKAAPDGAIGSLLAGIGYQVFGIKKYPTKLRLIPIRAEKDCVFNDYIAITGKIPVKAQIAYGLEKSA